jgi:enoyl-CoA hydratase/carnithine racemase
MRRGQLAFDSLEYLPIVIAAAINGFALGGGLELAMACDLRVASPRAKLANLRSHLAIFPDGEGHNVYLDWLGNRESPN